MDDKIYQERMVRAERARRLLENDDYKEIRNLEEQGVATLYHKLRDEITTDPRIAELQGQLKRLEATLNRPYDWLLEAKQTVQQVKIQERETSDSEDYESG